MGVRHRRRHRGTGADETFAPWKFSNPWFGTLRGRAGYAFSNVLFYGTGGLAFGELRGATFGLSETHTNAGWTRALGAEMAWPRTGARRSSTSMSISPAATSVITGVSNGYRFGVIRAGVNYHF